LKCELRPCDSYISGLFRRGARFNSVILLYIELYTSIILLAIQPTTCPTLVTSLAGKPTVVGALSNDLVSAGNPHGDAGFAKTLRPT
jgi:hypothetical protein